MTNLRVAFAGFGNVGRALHALLEQRREVLEREYGITFSVTGISSRRMGWMANGAGLDVMNPEGTDCRNIYQWLAESNADVVFEAIPLDANAGQPALDYLRAVLEHGADAISANKGPVVYGFRELTHLASVHGHGYAFEAAVMDGAPVFSLVRECLPLAGLRAVSGVFTSTATVVIEAVEEGLSIAQGIARAQQLGIAEADPSYDVDGWDSAVKLCAVANVLLSADLRPADVARQGLGSLDEAAIRRAHAEGRPYRLVGDIRPDERGVMRAVVRPVQCDTGGPLGVVHGATLVMHYEAEVFPGGLTVTSHDPDPTTTAYGMLADFVRLVRPAR
ncbi:MAG: homoserine dehydrogenase [bacterium]